MAASESSTDMLISVAITAAILDETKKLIKFLLITLSNCICGAEPYMLHLEKAASAL